MENTEQLNVYAAPTANLGVEENVDCAFFPTSLSKLLVLSIGTMGCYGIYWFYKQWKYQSRTMDKKISPALRSIFSIFFTHSLFKRVGIAAEEKGIEANVSYNGLATTFILLGLASWAIDLMVGYTTNFQLVQLTGIGIVILSVYPLYAIQYKINEINEDPQGRINSRFSLYNYLFMVLGSLLWLVVIAEFFLPGYLD